MIESYKGYIGYWRVIITDSYIKLASHGLDPTMGAMFFLHYNKGSYPNYTYSHDETEQLGQFITDDYIMKIIHKDDESSRNGEIILCDRDDTITLIHLYNIPDILIAGLHLLGCNKTPMFGIPYYDRDSEDSGYTGDTEADFSSDESE